MFKKIKNVLGIGSKEAIQVPNEPDRPETNRELEARLLSGEMTQKKMNQLRRAYYESILRLGEKYNKNQLFLSTTTGGFNNSRNIQVVYGKDIENTDVIDEYFESPEIRRLQIISTRRSPQNMRWIYNHDDACLTSGFLLNCAVNGSLSLTTKSKDEELAEYIDWYLEQIKITKIQNFSIKDNHCFADSVFWKEYCEEEEMIKVHHIDYITLTRVKNPINGMVKWIQMTSIDANVPKSKSNRKWKNYDPMMDYWQHTPEFNKPPSSEIVGVNLLREDVVNFNYFPTAPIIAIADICIWKKWMIFDAKLTGQKYASPIVDAVINLPDLYDIDSKDYDGLMTHLSNQIMKLQNNGVIAHSDKIELKTLQQNATGGYDYIGFWTSADKRIHKTLLVPYSLLEASGTELATNRSLKDMFNLVVNSIRSDFIKEIKKLVLEQLEFVGREVDPKDFELIYAEIDAQQQMTQQEEFTALLELYDRGIIKDENEVRSYVSKFGMELEPLTPQELKEIEDRKFNDAMGGIGGLTPQEVEEISNTYKGDKVVNDKEKNKKDKGKEKDKADK